MEARRVVGPCAPYLCDCTLCPISLVVVRPRWADTPYERCHQQHCFYPVSILAVQDPWVRLHSLCSVFRCSSIISPSLVTKRCVGNWTNVASSSCTTSSCIAARNFSVPRVGKKKKERRFLLSSSKTAPSVKRCHRHGVNDSLYSYNLEPTYEVPLNKSLS